MNIKTIILFLFYSLVGFASAQQISWTGSVDKISLFNKSNWIDEGTSAIFTGNMASDVPLNRDVYFGANAIIGTDKEVKGVFDAGTGFLKFKKATVRTDYAGVTGFKSAASISLDSAILLTGFVSAPTVVLSGNSQLHLYEADALSAGTKINILGENAWVFFHSLTAQQVIDRYAKQISIDGVASIPASNCRITQYYDGAVVIPHRSSIKALYLYSGANLTGTSKYFRVSYSNSSVLGNIGPGSSNKAASFLLKKGYMATITQNANGTGASKVYIAEDNDIIINGNINSKNDTVNIVRVSPWRWITKKGIGGNYTDFNVGWHYNWGPNTASTVDKEFVPMQWGTWNSDANAEAFKTKPDVTHVLGFNEPDHAEQSNMTVEQCLSLWPKLMLTGLRLGSPAITNLVQLNEFMDKALARGYRVDFICLHNYEKRTGDNYVNTICKPLYDKYKLPIWVTEFAYGAPWNTTGSDKLTTYISANKDYTAKMDAAPFIERYALFAFGNPVETTDSLFHSFEKWTGTSANSVLAARGVNYREYESLPSRGNPLIYRTKIAKAKKAFLASTEPVSYDNKCFSLISRNNDGTSRRKLQISTNVAKLNTAFMGGDGTTTAAATESFLFTKTDNNRFKLKVSNNCLVLSVRNDSVVVEAENNTDKQVWELVPITGTNYVAIKNVATAKFINPVANAMVIGTLISTVSSIDISALKSAHWQINASNVCNCTDPTLGVFDMKVEPLTGNAPLTVKMTGAKMTKENKEAFYRWYVFQGADTLISTFYNQDYTYTNPGTYRIQVRGRDYLSRITVKDFSISVLAPSAVDDTPEKSVRIFPNPVKDELNISGMALGSEIAIYNLQGKLILQAVFTGESIRTNLLSSGFYLLKSNGYAPVKLLKE